MKWLIFTKSNGEIDMLNIDKYNSSRAVKLAKFPKRFHGNSSDKHGPKSRLIPELNNAARIKTFIGDDGANRFSVQEAVKFPAWNSDNKEYVVDIVLKDLHTVEKAALVERVDLLQDLVSVVKNLRSRIKALEA